MTTLKPVYRPRASYDIESVVAYIGHVLDSPNAARAWYEQMKDVRSRRFRYAVWFKWFW